MDRQQNEPTFRLHGHLLVRLRITSRTRRDRQGRGQQCYIFVQVGERKGPRLGESE